MTDREKLKGLLTEWGVGFKEDGRGDIQCNQGKEKIEGYYGFYTDFEFDPKTGKFIKMGVWE